MRPILYNKDTFNFDFLEPDPLADIGQDVADPSVLAPLAASFWLAGSTTATASATKTVSTAAATVPAAAITLTTHSVLAGTNQATAISSLFNVASSSANPAYLIVSILDRDEYTVGYKTSAMGHFVAGSTTQGLTNFSGDGWSAGIVFTYQASTGQYVNTTFGTLSQLKFDTGTNLGDTATLSLFGTSNASLAATYASNPLILSQNPAYFTDYGSVAVVTGAAAITAPATATANSVVNAALSYVGQAWNDDGCWVLASDISAKAGATLPLTSTSIGVAGVANGEWFVAYNGPVAANSNWFANLTAGEIVSFQTTSGGGHITTVVSGQGSAAELVDNITYVNASGTIVDSANDGSANDIIVQAPHAATQEFTGVNAATVVVYELDAPVVTDTVASLSVCEGATVSMTGDFSASNPKAGESITQYQVYEANAADPLTLSGVADKAAISAATACSLTSLSGLGLTAATATGTDTIEVRAFNGSYWGDWTALNVTVTAPVQQTAAAALATTGTGLLAVSDTAANIGVSADKLQTLAASGRLVSVTVAGGGAVPLSVAQLTSDKNLLSLLPPTGAVQVSGATGAQAASLQSNAQVAAFTITDTAADVSGKTALGADTKLTSLSITGTTGADTLNLTGISAPASINLSGDTATVSGGLASPKISFLSSPDAITLGSGAATITAGISGSSGIETIANFQLGLDKLLLTLGTASAVTAIDTTYNGGHAIALTGGNSTQGVLLLGEASSVTAASLLGTHIHTSSGVATLT